MQDRFTQFDLLYRPLGMTMEQARRERQQRFPQRWEDLPQAVFSRRAMHWFMYHVVLVIRFWIRLFWKRLWKRFRRTAFAKSVAAWWQSFRRAFYALPQYQFVARIIRYLNAHPTTRIITVLGLIVVLCLPACFARLPEPSHAIYLVVDQQGPTVYQGYPDEDYDLGAVRVSSDDAGSDAQIILQEGQEVVIRYGDRRRTVVSRHETVANLLRRCRIQPQDDEMIAVNVSGDTPIIHISSELHYQRSEVTEVAYATKEITNPLAVKGTVSTIRAGKNGTVEDVYEDVYRMGQLVDSTLVDRSDNSSVTEILEVGTLVQSVDFEDKMVEDHPNRDGSKGGYLVFESGDSIVYVDKVVCNTTAYYSGGDGGAQFHTATGHAVGYGIIAADPKVFPYHSHLYVKGYGFSQVEDCGNFKGYGLDVWYETYWQCVVWGRRHVTVYVFDF